MIAFDWGKFLDVANALIPMNNPESNRSGISRSYYAAFGKSKVLLSNLNLVKSIELKDNSAKIHKFIIETLEDSEHEDLQFIGGRLKTLRARRNKADYDSSCSESGSSSQLVSSIKISKEIMEYIANFQP